LLTKIPDMAPVIAPLVPITPCVLTEVLLARTTACSYETCDLISLLESFHSL
jgi:hypothetical protein